MRLARAGEAPAVEIAIASGPVRTIAGRMKLHKRRHVHHVDEHRPSLGVVVHGDVHVRVVGRRDRHEHALQVLAVRHRRGAPSGSSPRPRTVASAGSASGAIKRHLAVAGQQPLDLLQADLPATDDHAAAALQLQAGDVEGRGEHVRDAALVADSLAQLADALLACIGLGGHALQVTTYAQARGYPPGRAPRRPARQACSRSESRVERSCAAAPCGLRRELVIRPPPQAARARRVPGDQLLLSACAQTGLAERASQAAAGGGAPRSARDSRARQVVVEPHHAGVELACDPHARGSGRRSTPRRRGRRGCRWPVRSLRTPSRRSSPQAPDRR